MTALFVLEKPVAMDYNWQFYQWYNFVLDIVDTKHFKSTIVISPNRKIPTKVYTLNFVNKGMEDINFSKIFQMKDVILFNLTSKTI